MSNDKFDSRARRGLATIAFLKARFDAGKDQLDLFQPLVDDAIRHYKTDDLELGGVQRAVHAATGVSLSSDILRTLLRRAAKRGLLTRRGGRYLRTPHQSEDEDFSTRIREIQRSHLQLGARLRGFIVSRGQKLASDDDALASLTQFLDENHIGIVLGQTLQPDTRVATDRMNRTVASFVAEVLNESSPDYATLEGIVKGLIVQNALLLRDIPAIRRDLYGLTVFVDTGVLLRALGYAGMTEQQAAREGLDLIHAAGARLRAFERTVNEMENVLRLYEWKLGSSEGIKSLWQTPLTRYFLGIKATPADLRQEIALVGKHLESLGVRIVEFPRHIHEHTADEETLAKLLRDPERNPDSDAERISHDVRAIAAVLTLRAGSRPTRLLDATYVFASGSGHTVSTAARWWRQEGRRDLEPLVHFRSVANAAWLLKPARASDAPMHELVAVCAATLRPSDRIWSDFVKRLDNLVASGELSDDESIAVLADELTQVRLSDHGPEDDVEASTVLEIVERVSAEHEHELRSQLDDRQRELEKSRHAATAAQAEVDSYRARVQAQAEGLAKAMAAVVYAFLCVPLVVGAVLTLPTQWSDPPQASVVVNLVWWLCVVLFFALSLLGFFIRRFHVLNFFDRLKAWFTPRLRRILLPEADHDGS